MKVGRGGELSFGKSVAAVVFNNVDVLGVAAAEVLELTHADIGGVAVTADADREQAVVGDRRAGGDGRHPAVEGVEAVAVLQEVSGGFAEQPMPLILTVS